MEGKIQRKSRDWINDRLANGSDLGRTMSRALQVGVQVSGDAGKAWFPCGDGWGGWVVMCPWEHLVTCLLDTEIYTSKSQRAGQEGKAVTSLDYLGAWELTSWNWIEHSKPAELGENCTLMIIIATSTDWAIHCNPHTAVGVLCAPLLILISRWEMSPIFQVSKLSLWEICPIVRASPGPYCRGWTTPSSHMGL